ncbi:MAG: hypothetical protein Q9162_003885 [Coniocarpon cinnabarinum]
MDLNDDHQSQRTFAAHSPSFSPGLDDTELDRAIFDSLTQLSPKGIAVLPVLNVEDVRAKSISLSTDIFASWRTLRGIIERHEATIQKRWLKRKLEQRWKILKYAWPDMPDDHRPDLKEFRQSIEPVIEHEGYYMWPHINTYDLSKPKPLLMLLNARARSQPYEFAFADLNSCRFGIGSGLLRPGVLDSHFMSFVGRTRPGAYGELNEKYDVPSSCGW